MIPVRTRLEATVSHVVDTTGGDQLVLHENRPPAGTARRRDVLLVHGIGGSHHSPYIRRAAGLLGQAGYRTWRLDQRGCGAGAQLARHHYHAGRTEDLQAAIAHILLESGAAGQSPVPLTVVGFSLGGNVLLKWLGESDDQTLGPVDSAIAVTPPVNLLHGVHCLEQGLGRIYDRFFAHVLRRKIVERRRLRPDIHDTGIHPIPRKLYQIDDQFTAPLAGFDSAETYYRECSALPWLPRIRTETLIIADRDDPVVPADTFAQCRFPDCLQLLLTRGGGHIGYRAVRSIDGDGNWLDWRILDWINSVHADSGSGMV